MKFKIKDKYWFKKDFFDYYHCHIYWSILNKDFKEKGMLTFNWYWERFNLGFRMSIGKNGIDISLSLWFCVDFSYCWGK